MTTLMNISRYDSINCDLSITVLCIEHDSTMVTFNTNVLCRVIPRIMKKDDDKDSVDVASALAHKCGTLKCKNASIYEKVLYLDVKNNSKCEKFGSLIVLNILHYFSHIASIVTFSVDISSHLATFSHIEAFSHCRMPQTKYSIKCLH